MNIFSLIWGLITGKAGEAVGGAVSTGVQIAALIAAITPFALWFLDNKDTVFIQVTYGQLMFWGGLIAGLVLLAVRLVHYASPPAK